MEQRRRAAVVAQPSERRNRRQDIEASRVELRGVTCMPSSDAAATLPQPATPRGADADLSGAHAPGSASTLGMFSPAVSSGAESAGEPGPSTATVDSDAARFTEISRGNPSRHVQDAPLDSSATHPLRREEFIPDSMRKTTLANLKTKTLKAFRNIFAHHKNAHAKISDWVSYIPVELHTQVRARIRSVVDTKKSAGTSSMFSSAATSELPSTRAAALGSIKTSSTVNTFILCQLYTCAAVNRFSSVLGTMRHWSE